MVLCQWYVHMWSCIVDCSSGKSPDISLVTRYMTLVVFQKHFTKTLFIGCYCEIRDVISYLSYCEILMSSRDFTRVLYGSLVFISGHIPVHRLIGTLVLPLPPLSKHILLPY